MAKYFNDEEVKGLNNRLIVLLDQMREVAGTPIIITSGIRSQEQNENADGVKDSAHLNGLAVDIRCGESVCRYKYINAAIRVGFKRIGLYNYHIHLDIDDTKPQNIVWVGISH